jgi:membrane-bound lytic murein transglycosylase
VNKLIASTLVSIGLIAATASLAAAPAATPPTTPGAQTQQGARHHHEKHAFSLPSERVDARLAYMKTALKITDAQQPQWNAFADVLRKQTGERDQQIQAWRARMAQGTTKHEKRTAIARVERQQQRYAAALTRLNEQLAVQRPLYAALTADQKAIADEVLAPRSRHGGFRHHGKRSAA